jgi:hypothetical protein
MDYKILSKVQEEKDKIRDLACEIKDLEAELEFMHLREPDEAKYIMYLERRINALYDQVEAIKGLNDENN